MDCDCGSTGTMIWKEADTLPPRVKRLRDEYFSFYERDYFRNEALGFSTGAQWDVLWRSYNWGINPEIFPFFAAIEDSLLASAVIVKTPESFWKLPLVRRRSLFFSEVLRKHLPAQILEGELIVGAQFNNAMSLCLNKAEAKGFRAAQKKWWDAAQVLNDTGVGNCGAVPGHLIPNYKKAVEIGFAGYAEEIKAELRKQPDERKRAQLQAMLECCEAVPDFTSRYAAEAERLAAAEGDAARRAELAEIARVCRKVPWNPPETFAESLQAVWFTHMLAMFSESYPGPGVSHGRIDQYLFPLYKKSVEQGMTREQARELLMCFWIKHNYAYDFMGRVGANQGINSGFGQLVTLSGCGPDGSDLTNELTMLMLDVIEEINMLEPKPNVRLHRNSPPELVERVGGMLSKAQGAPVLLNFDEASMRGLKWQGMPEGELWDYAPVGCLENAFQGCDRSGTVDVNLNLAKAVELTLNDGCDLATGWRIGPKTGDPAAFDSFDKFYAAFNAQLDALLDVICECVETADFVRSKYEFIPYLSVLVDGCMENGRDINEGGAKYNYITVEGIAFGTTVDSVAAVKKVVFEEGRVSMPDLVAAIKANYEGHEKTRQFMMNRAPKYGTDDNEADALAAEINKRWTERAFARVSPHTGKRFRGGYLSWNYWIAYAPFTAATPDGRKRGSFLSNGIGPVNGMDRKGPTANIRSVGKVGLESAPNGASHTISVSPSLLRDPEHVTKLSSMLRAYALEGGTALQVNVLDPDTLRRAQKNPEEYRNLLVRVTGYNAYFVNLGREIQDEIIAREAGVL
ncbi:MAG TPA: pyruvate formate lyase family protein [bacterium]|nr:pyruvate formate lyase family protein [bacterium]HPN95302.1 pyruvate formate lyase family protein [bacterium]